MVFSLYSLILLVFFGAAVLEETTAGIAAAVPGPAEWGLVVADTCTAIAPSETNPIKPGENATILIGWDEAFLSPSAQLKVGRPVFVTVTTDAGNVITKTVINGRSVG